MSYDLGLKALKRLVLSQDKMEWYKAKLTPQLFSSSEVKAFEWVEKHVRDHHTLPHMDTFLSAWPQAEPVPVVEPVSYYLQKLESAFFHRLINDCNLKSQSLLKSNQDDWQGASQVMRGALDTIVHQNNRTRIVDFAND